MFKACEGRTFWRATCSWAGLRHRVAASALLRNPHPRMHQRAPRLLAPPTVQAVVAPEGSRFGRARKRAREEGPAREDTAPARSASTLAVSLVCACNMNRSMSAHVLLEGAGYRLLSSYGTSDAVRLPHRRGPIAFQWGGSGYADMEDEMSRTYPDQVWMQVTGIAGMLQRNARLKARPESWYAQEDEDVRRHDVVVVFDAYAYQQVILGEWGVVGREA